MPKESMWASTRAKKAANKDHAANYEAGRVNVHERALHRTGLRGRKIIFCCLLLVFVYLITLANLVITAYILGALYFTAGGPSSLQYSGDNMLFLQDVMATRVHINGDISSIGSGDISVKASDMGVLLQGGNYRNTPSGGAALPPSQMVSNSNGREGLSLEPHSSLHLRSSTGEEVLGISQAGMISSGPQTLAAMTVDSRLEADTVNFESSSSVYSDSMLSLRGGRRVNVNTTGSIVLSAAGGDIVLLGKTLNIPGITRQSTINLKAGGGGVRWSPSSLTTNNNFNLCVCGSGQLVPVASDPNVMSVCEEVCT